MECPRCYLEPEDPENMLHLAIFGHCIDCIRKNDLTLQELRLRRRH